MNSSGSSTCTPISFQTAVREGWCWRPQNACRTGGMTCMSSASEPTTASSDTSGTRFVFMRLADRCRRAYCSGFGSDAVLKQFKRSSMRSSGRMASEEPCCFRRYFRRTGGARPLPVDTRNSPASGIARNLRRLFTQTCGSEVCHGQKTGLRS